MYYTSTRDASLRLTASEAIVQGLSREGGLFLPSDIPRLPDGALRALADMSYEQRAVRIMKPYLDEFTEDELAAFAARAYAVPGKFDDPAVAPLRAYDGDTWFLELWHGPTCAFKDMALQMLPWLLTASLRKTGEEKTACILVATSGDTGKAALEGFRDVERTKILVFYPDGGVSDIQKLQMVTQAGGNVGVCAVEGNFDDAQSGVKAIFSDAAMRARLARRGCLLSSANSINWGRVLPQIVYYVSAYAELMGRGAVAPGAPVNFCVPTGNFGNILAAYYAKRMGVPVGKLICASNANDVLTGFLRTGRYDRNRPFYNTISPSMDILISSNLERLLYLLSGSDGAVRGYMDALGKDGRYQVSEPLLGAIRETFRAGCCDDRRTMDCIRRLFRTGGYLADPHTAVAAAALADYRAETGDETPAVVVSTASPFKFCSSVLTALGETEQAPGVEILDQLAAKTGRQVPAPLAGLRGRTVRFTEVCGKDEMAARVSELLG